MDQMPKHPLQRLHDAVMAALQAAGGSMQVVNLNKTLFYADLYALRDCGHTVTGQEYLALKLGPVVMGYDKRIIRDLARAGFIVQEEAPGGYGKPLRVVRQLETYESLTTEEIHILKELAPEIAQMSAASVSNLSHDNPGWNLAWKGEGKPPGKINMLIAMQQLDDTDENDDAWLKARLTKDERATVAESVSDPGEAWGTRERAG